MVKAERTHIFVRFRSVYLYVVRNSARERHAGIQRRELTVYRELSEWRTRRIIKIRFGAVNSFVARATTVRSERRLTVARAVLSRLPDSFFR